MLVAVKENALSDMAENLFLRYESNTVAYDGASCMHLTPDRTLLKSHVLGQSSLFTLNYSVYAANWTLVSYIRIEVTLR
jgi:hypothetical protein